jgi:hypothetical protein
MTWLITQVAHVVLNGADNVKRVSMGLMLESYERLFIERLRNGIASPEEMALAADLIEKKKKQRRASRPFWLINEAIVLKVLIRETDPELVPKTLVPDVAASFKVSERQVYKALAERGLAKKETRRSLVENIRKVHLQLLEKYPNGLHGR